MMRLSRLLSLLALIAVASAPSSQESAAGRLERLRAQAAIELHQVPRLVLAFYYGWYATPEVSGRWSHWSDVDLEARRLSDSANFPATGPYDSHDPEVIARHCREAKRAGLDGLIATWWHPGDFHDRGFPLLLDAAAEEDLDVSAYFEVVPSRTREQALAMCSELLRAHASHPAWLRVDGSPVLFVYGRAVENIGLDGWSWVNARLNAELEDGVVLIGDRISAGAARVFHGIHTYNVTGSTAGQSLELMDDWARRFYGGHAAIAGGRIACATVIPGYDDTKLGREGERPTTLRHGGRTYATLWEAALASELDWVLITSFNEWHEGSEIEPSVENGERELAATAGFAERFRALPPRERLGAAARSEELEARAAEVSAAFAERPIALFPEGGSSGLAATLDLGMPLTALEWEELVDAEWLTPERFPVLLYPGGETYRATVREADDVPRALARYVEAGGVLVALPSGPMPFHYARESGQEAVQHWRELGFPLRIAWERAPEGEGMELETATPIADVPARFAIPEGDARWRPLLARDSTPIESWIHMRDAAGEHHGTGAGLVRRGEGALVYAWFRLADPPYGEALVLEVWARVVAFLDAR